MRRLAFVGILAAVGLVLAQVPPDRGVSKPGQRTDLDPNPPRRPVTAPTIPPVIAVKDVPTGAFFRLARHWAGPEVYMLVHPEGLPLPANHAPFGISYQPTNDGNSVYAVDCSNGKLWRMLATLPCVREPRLTMQFRYDRSDLNYHLPGSDPDR